MSAVVLEVRGAYNNDGYGSWNSEEPLKHDGYTVVEIAGNLQTLAIHYPNHDFCRLLL